MKKLLIAGLILAAGSLYSMDWTIAAINDKIQTPIKAEVKKTVKPALKPGVFQNGKMVTFVYVTNDEGITSVALTGDFNNWNPEGIPFKYENGSWVLVISLEPGVYQYKLVLNETQFIENPYSNSSSPDGKGGMNSVLEVE